MRGEVVGPDPAESPRQGAGHRWQPLKKQMGSICGCRLGRHPDQRMRIALGEIRCRATGVE